MESTPRIFRRFILSRHEDACGVSGTGLVAEGIEFSSGRCVICWLTLTPSIAVYENIADVEKVHGHGGKTVIKWLDNA
jgi:hypothetical protein